MPRLFIALDLPEWAKDKLADIANNLPGASWSPQEQYHLTLSFLGDIDQDKMDVLQDGLAGLRAKSFYLTLRGLGHFPLRGDPEILWVGVERNEPLQSLQHKVERLVTAHGLEPDGRKFFPHVTLAKIREARQEWIGKYFVEHALFALHDIPIQAFSLISSRLTPEGSIHHVEATYPLDGLLEVE